MVQVPVGGIGMVAVDLLHKKEHVARDLVTFFLDHYRTRGMPLGLLYPFRPDFYKQMGFGYGTKMSEYRVRPSDLPAYGSKDHLVNLGPEDSELLLDYYNRYQMRTHGMLRRTTFEIARKLRTRKTISSAIGKTVGCTDTCSTTSGPRMRETFCSTTWRCLSASTTPRRC